MIVLEKMVDLSPLYISLKTAIITIVITKAINVIPLISFVLILFCPPMLSYNH